MVKKMASSTDLTDQPVPNLLLISWNQIIYCIATDGKLLHVALIHFHFSPHLPPALKLSAFLRAFSLLLCKLFTSPLRQKIYHIVIFPDTKFNLINLR